jgi:protein ImuB
MATRTLVVWCPDWPLVAAGVASDVPAAVFHANRVVAATAAARADGVRQGLRLREAQGRCPALSVLGRDQAAEARAFEPVVAVVEAFTPRVEITRPGVCALATRGPSRYFGGDEVFAGRVRDAVEGVSSLVTCRVGVADGAFTAALAARRGLVVPSGASRLFLAPLPVGLLDQHELTDLLIRLGLTTMGDLAALSAADVVARFGAEGELAHRRARGLDDRPLLARVPPPELTTVIELDPPADRVDTAAFAAKSAADLLVEALSTAGLVCTCIRIEVETEYGEAFCRVWRHHRSFSPAAVADRVRWQLEGWLTQHATCGCPAGSGEPPCPGGTDCPNPAGGTCGGLTLLRLVPEEVIVDDGRQLGFWGGASAADERAERGLARLQGLLGPEAVCTAVVGGGRDPGSQVRLVPWGDPREPARPGTPLRPTLPPPTFDGLPAPISKRTRSAGRSPSPTEVPAWPGRIPAPFPSLVHRRPVPAAVVDDESRPVVVSGRGLLCGAPARLSVDGGPWTGIDAWAGPWPSDERWWDPSIHRRRARLQAVTAEGAAFLLVLEAGRWWVEATYD